MREYDKNAVPAERLSIKLRGPDNGKLPRTPYNVEQAIAALFVEALSLSGEEAAYRVMREMATAFAHDKGWIEGEHPSGSVQMEYDVAAATEMLVNMFQSKLGNITTWSGEDIADKIVSELYDMELLKGAKE